MTYTKEFKEYVKLRLETITSDTAIARDCILKFNLDKSIDAVRVKIKSIKNDYNLKAKQKPFKRLFFDIETTYVKANVWRQGKQYIRPEQIVTEKKIICISYKWQGDNKVYSVQWNDKHSDKKLVKDFVKILNEADEIIAHNGDRFDIKELRTRAILNGVLMFPKYQTLDTLKKARKYFSFTSNKLDLLGNYFEVGRKLPHEGFKLWEKTVEGTKAEQKEYLTKMVSYCEQDVLLLEDVFSVLTPYIDYNTNLAVLKGGKKWQCPECASTEVNLSHTHTTPLGYIKRFMVCKCKKSYNISNKTYTDFLLRKLKNGDIN